jgi:hypothetical protein
VSDGAGDTRSRRQDGPELNPLLLVRDSMAALGQTDLFLRLATVPAVGLFVCELLVYLFGLKIEIDPTGATPPSGATVMALLLNYLILLIFTTMFTVNWTRALLLGPAAVAGLGLQWGARQTRYMLRAAAIAIVPGLAVMLAMLPILALFGESAISGAVMLIVLVVYLFVVVRLSLLLPAAALDHPFSLREALALPGRLAARLLAAQILVTLPYVVGALLLSLVMELVGLTRVAPFASQFVFLVLAFLFFAVSAGIYALAFQAIVGSRPQGRLTA